MFRFHGNGLFKGYFYEILPKIMLFSFTVNFSSDLIKSDDVIGIAQYLADKQNFLYIYLFS